MFDPEIPVDIYELGLIYKVDVSDEKDVAIDMTLTAPGCPVAGEMPGWVEDAVMEIADIKSCHVDLVFEPPWDPVADERRGQAATEHVLMVQIPWKPPSPRASVAPPQGRHPDARPPPRG